MMVHRDIESRGTVIPRRDYRRNVTQFTECQRVRPKILRGMRAPPLAPLYARTETCPFCTEITK